MIISNIPLFYRFALCKIRRRTIAASIFSILLHCLALSIFIGWHTLHRSAPEKSASRLTVTLTPIFEQLASQVAQRKFVASPPLPTRTQGNKVSEYPNPVRPEKAAREPSSTESPIVDIDAARALARRFARETAGSSGQRSRPAQFPVERETALGASIAKAARQDCRNAHAGLGLLALPFLIKDAVTNSGCKW